jgi:hypothetical protein
MKVIDRHHSFFQSLFCHAGRIEERAAAVNAANAIHDRQNLFAKRQ